MTGAIFYVGADADNWKTLANNTTLAAGLILALGALLSGNNPLVNHKKTFSVPHTYADVPASPATSPETCLRENSKGEINVSTNCLIMEAVVEVEVDSGNLVISAGSMTAQTYLQTLFPRYVQTAQEVVRIPVHSSNQR
ncbi:MAG: hypothetical protein R3B69_02765 [Candidatus Paceibacterota bacterium]